MRLRSPFSVIVLLSAAAAAAAAPAAKSGAIQAVRVEPPSLNLAAHEMATVSATFTRPGTASVLLVDRDGYAVRTLAKAQPVDGPVSFGWDGRDDAGELVADEAYSLKIDWRGSGGGIETCFPANAPAKVVAVSARSYDRRTATLSYTLERPSRVHVQAGTAAVNGKSNMDGPVMKTVVNREPRAGGAIAEHWSGYDESGTIFVPDLQGFAVAIAAAPLPESSIITFGNRKRQFVETLAARKGSSLFTFARTHMHHGGLETADDVSPALSLEPLNATWSKTDRTWVMPEAGPLKLRVSVHGPTATQFLAQPAKVERYVDSRNVGSIPPQKNHDIIEVPIAAGSSTRRVSINWVSDWGPLAANSLRVRVGDRAVATGGGGQ